MPMSFEGSIYKKPVAEQVPKGFGEIDLDGNFGTDNLPVPIEGDMPVIQEMANEGEVFGNVIETPVNDSVEAANDQYYEVNNNDIEDVEWREASEDSIETEVVSSENESLEGLNEDKKIGHIMLEKRSEKPVVTFPNLLKDGEVV